MATGIVYDGVPRADGEASGSSDKLFSGMKFWLSHSIPQRQWLLQNAQANGAEIVPLEKQADVLFVDHARKNQAPGTHSYRFIELSIRNGQVEDLDAHAVGVATRVQRTVGSTITAPKRGRNPFTDAEDQWLWNMIKPYMDGGGNHKGNEIYKQLERLNSRHTYQSWRDRWIKYVVNQKRQITQDFDREALMEELEVSQLVQSRQDAAMHPQRYGRPEPQQRATERPSSSTDSATREQVVEQADETKANAQSPQPASRKRKITVGIDDTLAITPTKRAVPWFGPKRTRPLNDEQTRPYTPNTDGETSASSSHSKTPPAVTPQSLRTPGVHRDPVNFSRIELGQFSAKEASELYRCVYYVQLCPGKYREEAWGEYAQDRSESGHTPEAWKSFYEAVILPKYRSRRENRSLPDRDGSDDEEPTTFRTRKSRSVEPGPSRSGNDEDETDHPQESNIRSIPYETTCIKCLTTESTKWRQDKKGRTLCEDCGQLSRRIGVLRPSTALLDMAHELVEEGLGEEQEVESEEREVAPRVQQGPVQQPAQPESARTPSLLPSPSKRMVDRGSSPILPSFNVDQNRQESPFFEPLSPSALRAPEPNEARKRSAVRSQSTSQETAKSNAILKEAVEDDFMRRLQTPPISLRKKKRLSDDLTTLEIPPTPEHVQQESGSLRDMPAQPASPQLPQPRPASKRKSPPPKSTIFMSESEEDDESDNAQLETAPTSPIMVSLVSDPIGKSSQPNQDDVSSDIETGSVYNWETAPDISHEWETAPESPKLAEERVKTQALFHDSNAVDLTEEDLELPAPRGGWEALQIPETDVAESIEPTEDDAEASSELEVISWITKQKAQRSDMNPQHMETMLQAAIESTSFDLEVGERVIEEMISMYMSGKAKKVIGEGGVMLPKNFPGCWTEQDDNKLLSNDAHDIAQVHGKHGNDSCLQRLNFIEEWQAT